MLNKRGQTDAGSVVTELFSVQTGMLIILAVGLLIGLFVIFSFINRDSFFEKKVLAEELALTIEALQLFEGNTYLYYFTPYNFSVEHGQGFIATGTAPGREQSRYFVDKALTYPSATIANSDELLIAKEGRSLTINDLPHTTNPTLLDCERPSSVLGLTGITLDPQHGGTDPGLSTAERNESLISRTLARRLQSFDRQFYTTSVRLDVDATVAPSHRNYAGAVLSLSLSNTSSSQQYLRAYVHAGEHITQNRYLACLILNALSKEHRANNALQGMSIVPINPRAVQTDGEHYALTQQPIGIEIEYASIHDPAIEDKLPKIAQSIHNALTEYGRTHVST